MQGTLSFPPAPYSRVYLDPTHGPMVYRDGLRQTAEEFNNSPMPNNMSMAELESLLTQLRGLGFNP